MLITFAINVITKCVVAENIHTPTTEGFLVYTPPTPQEFPFQGVVDDPPPPRNFHYFQTWTALPPGKSKWFYSFENEDYNSVTQTRKPIRWWRGGGLVEFDAVQTSFKITSYLCCSGPGGGSMDILWNHTICLNKHGLPVI